MKHRLPVSDFCDTRDPAKLCADRGTQTGSLCYMKPDKDGITNLHRKTSGGNSMKRARIISVSLVLFSIFAIGPAIFQ